MPNHFIPVSHASVTSSVGVQNQKDEAGNVTTYVAVKGTIANCVSHDGGQTTNIIFKVLRKDIPAMVNSLVLAFSGSAVTGSF
jgi:hypothetical protein